MIPIAKEFFNKVEDKESQSIRLFVLIVSTVGYSLSLQLSAF
jgi:hypothetical protein